LKGEQNNIDATDRVAVIRVAKVIGRIGSKVEPNVCSCFMYNDNLRYGSTFSSTPLVSSSLAHVLMHIDGLAPYVTATGTR
jgi:hypothetical protein